MSEIKRRLNKIIEVLNNKEGTPNIPIIMLDADGIYKMSDKGQEIKFNTEQDLKDYFNRQDELTGQKTRYVIIKIIADNPNLESAFYNVD